jgi:hypothetical protein
MIVPGRSAPVRNAGLYKTRWPGASWTPTASSRIGVSITAPPAVADGTADDRPDVAVLDDNGAS